MKKLFTFALLVVLSGMAISQEYKPDNILYGVAYYDAYMPQSRIAEDIELMKECGINTVRIAESTWSVWEPRDGVFDFTRMDNMLDAFHEAGIKVIVGTPTYAIPQWLARKYPDILVTKFKGQEDYGSRQNMDIVNPDYRRHAERIIRKMISHVADHPAVIGYQLDNETKSYETASEYAKDLFRERLREKFVTTDSLNRTWNMYYWSQSVSTFDEIHISGSMANQAINLEWGRFQQDLATEFLMWQRAIVDEYRRPDQFVTQNFDFHWKGRSAGPKERVDHFEAAEAVNIAGVDIYHESQDRLDGSMIAFGGDNTRGLKNDNYFVIETNCQGTGWHSDNLFPPYDGQLRLQFFAHLASGANMVAYWPWHTIHNGGETFWKGILGHDMKPNRGFEEVKQTSADMRKIENKIIDLKKNNKAAILYSIDSFNALQLKHLRDGVDYADIFMQIYEAFYKNNIETDIITQNNFDPEKYDLVIIPPLLISDDEMLEKIDDYVKAGGHVLMFYKSGLADENYNMRMETMPGKLREVAGFSYQDYTNTIHPIPLKGHDFETEEGEAYCHNFLELLRPEGCEVIARYDHKHWQEYAAITRNTTGRGQMTYVGTLVSDQVMDQVAEMVIEDARLMGDVQQLQFPIIVRSGNNNQGKTIRYYFNFSDETQSFEYPIVNGTNILTGDDVSKGQQVSLPAWDLMIVESNK